MTAPRATGAMHPILDGPDNAWCVIGDNEDGVWAWMQRGPDGQPCVVLQGPDGEVHIPRDRLALVSRALIAAHVDAGRPDRWPPAG